MEASGTFEFLVKLASFGTAGVCVLAIFFIGSAIIKLPNDSPSWKPQIMKRFINACIIIAGITTVSGGLNAYFNRDKVVKADQKAETSMNETDKVAEEYMKLTAQYNDLSAKVSSLVELIGQNNSAPSQPVAEATNQVLQEIRVERPVPLNTILDERSTYMQRRAKINPELQEGIEKRR